MTSIAPSNPNGDATRPFYASGALRPNSRHIAVFRSKRDTDGLVLNCAVVDVVLMCAAFDLLMKNCVGIELPCRYCELGAQ
jgi:hypothetical protein